MQNSCLFVAIRDALDRDIEKEVDSLFRKLQDFLIFKFTVNLLRPLLLVICNKTLAKRLSRAPWILFVSEISPIERPPRKMLHDDSLAKSIWTLPRRVAHPWHGRQWRRPLSLLFVSPPDIVQVFPVAIAWPTARVLCRDFRRLKAKSKCSPLGFPQKIDGS